ncbi:MAG: 50S ribosomal protein L18 [Candidatus Pacebacteria bacterium]|nr:50S ribosomal protein L18 [Candidatus Paceibacterota bacterium]
MKNLEKIKKENKARRHNKVRSKIFGSAKIPRLNVYRSNKGLFIQLIDDQTGVTLASINDQEVKSGKTKTEKATEAGKLIAKKAEEKKITEVVFDRGGCKYHGRIKAVADGAREGGLKF